ncbi:hypothetical protein ACIQK6_41545, partial [Streptomyces sp. NPDC091682]
EPPPSPSPHDHPKRPHTRHHVLDEGHRDTPPEQPAAPDPGEAPVHAEAGDCVVVTGPENAPKVESKGCTEKVADLCKVVKVVDNTFDLDKRNGVADAALAQQLETDKFVLCMEPVKN